MKAPRKDQIPNPEPQTNPKSQVPMGGHANFRDSVDGLDRSRL